MDNDLTGDELYNQALSFLKITGTKEETQEITEFIHMLASVPTGQDMLAKIVKRGDTIPINVVSTMEGSSADSKYKATGCVNGKTKTIRMCWTNLPPIKKEEDVLVSQIVKATMLGHELMHHLNLSKIKELNHYCSDLDEAVLVQDLDEFYAYMIQEQLKRELGAKHHLIKPKIVNGKISDSLTTISIPERKRELRRVLSGGSRKLNSYKTEKRIKFAKAQPPPPDFTRTCIFREKVGSFLKEMQIDMPFFEIMFLEKLSLKLLPDPRLRSTEVKR